MRYEKEERQNINQGLETILFNLDTLNALKSAIRKVDTGQISSRELWDLVISIRAGFIEKIVDFVMFQKANHSDRKGINNISNKNHPEEKDALLQELGIRINRIYTKLKEKIDS